jgi:hypothetical protein
VDDAIVDVSRPESDQARGIYFWRSCGLQLSNRRTEFTPHWCSSCRFAFATVCVCSLKEESPMDGAVAEDKKKPNVKIEKFTRPLKVPLKPDELSSRADRAAHLIGQLDQKEEERKAANTAAKAQIAELDAELRRISGEIRDKHTFETVDCERRYEYRTGRVYEVRLDTNETLHEKPMSLEERQLELGIDEALDDADGDEGDDDDGAGDTDDDPVIEDEEADRIKNGQKHPPLATEKRKAARRKQKRPKPGSR